MKKRWKYGATFVAVYMFFLLLTIPAVWVVEQVGAPQGVDIKSTKGSLWHAHFSAITLPNNVQLHNVEVRIKPLTFLWFSPTAEITFGGRNLPGPEGSMLVKGLFSSLELEDVNLSLNAQDIVPLINLPLALTAHNYIKLSVPNYAMGSPICELATGNVVWNKASITAYEERIELGDLQGDFHCDKGELLFTFNPDNNLGLNFTAILHEPGRASGLGYLAPADKFPEKLSLALPFLGKANAKGQYPLRF